MAKSKGSGKKRDWTKSKYSGVLPLLRRELKDGQAYEAMVGKDFTCTPQSFAGQIGAIARDQGLQATAITTGTRVIYRFYDPTGMWKPNLAAFPVVRRVRRHPD